MRDLMWFKKYISTRENPIFSYEDVVELLEKIKKSSKLKIVDNTKEHTTRGYPLIHYTVGDGDKHIVMVGLTHGNENITTDFVLQFLDSLVNQLPPTDQIDIKRYTIHFIPLLNPEGFINTSAAIQTRISPKHNLEEMEKICFDYYTRFKNDDIYTKDNPQDKSVREYQLFVDPLKIDVKKHPAVLNHALSLIKKHELPIGSLISWRANGNGIDLNNNTHYRKRKELITKKIVYGGYRYNNIKLGLEGPLGARFNEKGETELENQFLENLLSKLHRDKKLAGVLNYHSTGGTIFYRPYFYVHDIKIDLEKLKEKSKKNLNLAKIYSKATDYPINYKMPYGNNDDLLRILYPNVLLIELSKMGGNPLAPYGDLKNVTRVINDNIKGATEVIIALGE